jgi:Holliday junction resolvase
MASTPEKKVKDKVVKLLKEEGVYYFYASTHGFGRSGIPDLVCCINGRFLGIECKAGDNKPTALQQRELAAKEQRATLKSLIALILIKRRADGIGLLSLCTTGLFVGTLVAR